MALGRAILSLQGRHLSVRHPVLCMVTCPTWGAEPAQVCRCRVRPVRLRLILSIPPAPTSSSEGVGKLDGDGSGIYHGVMSTHPMPWPKAAMGKVAAGHAVGRLWSHTQYALPGSLLGCSAALH